MQFVYRLVAVILGVVATGVALHFVFEAFYEDVVDTGQVWDIIDWFMAVALLAVLAVNYSLKLELDGQRADSSPVSREYLAVNVGVYASIIVALLFFWNWFDNLTIGAEEQSTLRGYIWTLLDPVFAVVVGTTACRLWRLTTR